MSFFSCLALSTNPGWLAAGTHKRTSENIFGDESVVGVWEGNLMTIHVAYLQLLMIFRKVYVLVEQPNDSRQPEHPAQNFVWELSETRPMLTWLGAFGNIIPKPTHLWTTMPRKVAKKHLKRSKPPAGTLQQSTRKSSSGSVTGNKNLEDSEHYTPAFAAAIAACFAEVSERDASRSLRAQGLSSV
jgi:hypothetical protein